MILKPGGIYRFTYNHLVTDEDSGDRFKEVWVLNPSWQRKVHAIDLKRLTAAEREVLSAIMDPETKKTTHRLPLVNDVVRRMDPITEITNPMTFYGKFVKVFLRNKDAYRTYHPERMLNVTEVKDSVAGKTYNPKPLFRKPESPKPPEAPKKELSAAEKMANIRAVAQRAAKKKT
jgi:hypothetical protein